MKFECAYIKLLEVEHVVPNPKNNNRHSLEQIERLAKIIESQGQRSPLVISKRSGFLVKGHCRLEAIKKLGWTKVAVDYQDYESEAQEYADMTADNTIASWAQFDFAEFKMELDKLDFNFEIDLFGLETFGKILDQDELKIKKDLTEEERKWIIEVKFPNEMEMRDIHDDLMSRGYFVKVKGDKK